MQNYMEYADAKLREEEARGARYLESSADSLEKVKNCQIQLGILIEIVPKFGNFELGWILHSSMKYQFMRNWPGIQIF